MQRLIPVIAICSLLTGLASTSTTFAQSVEKPTQVDIPSIELTLDGPERVLTSENANYTISGKIGISTATGVVLRAPLPETATFVSADQNGHYDEQNRTISWSLGSQGPDDSFSVVFGILVNSEIDDLTQVPLSATLETNQNVPISADLTVEVSAPILQVKSSVDPTTILPGGTATISLMVTNDGTATANNLRIDATLPKGLTAPDNKGNQIALQLGDIASKNDAVANFSIRADTDQPAGPLTITSSLSGVNAQPVTIDTLITIKAQTPPEEFVLPPTAHGEVLGASTELSETGMSFTDWLLITLASFLITAGITTLFFYPFPPRVKQ